MTTNELLRLLKNRISDKPPRFSTPFRAWTDIFYRRPKNYLVERDSGVLADGPYLVFRKYKQYSNEKYLIGYVRDGKIYRDVVYSVFYREISVEKEIEEYEELKRQLKLVSDADF